MSVYFVYRTTYDSPMEKHVRRFDDDTVLAWARRVWRPIADHEQAWKYGDELLGGLSVYSFGSLFSGPAEQNDPPPKRMANVAGWFNHMYTNEVLHGPHHLQLLTDDDETEMAVYLFDDHYRAAHPGRTDYLLHDGWELPDGDAEGPKRSLRNTWPEKRKGDGEGSLYSVCLAAFDSCNLSDLGDSSPRIDGLRLDGLCRYVLTHPDEEDLGYDHQRLRKVIEEMLAKPRGKDAGFLKAIREEPDDLSHWNAYSDWLLERDEPAAGLHLLEKALRRVGPTSVRDNRVAKRDQARVTAHMAQASMHEGSWPDDPFMWFTPHHTYETWIFFDDRWVAAQRALAEGLMRFSQRWDVL